jgi:NADH-quinone oxidoreductase subunit A
MPLVINLTLSIGQSACLAAGGYSLRIQCRVKLGEEFHQMPSDYVPILIFAVVAVALSAIAVLMPALFGPKRPSDVKLAPYESGKLPIGPARRRFPIQYYLFAVLFILFDIEIIFLFPWATVFRDLSPRWLGLLEAGIFVGILVLGLVYVWKKGGLEWE